MSGASGTPWTFVKGPSIDPQRFLANTKIPTDNKETEQKSKDVCPDEETRLALKWAFESLATVKMHLATDPDLSVGVQVNHKDIRNWVALEKLAELLDMVFIRESNVYLACYIYSFYRCKADIPKSKRPIEWREEVWNGMKVRVAI